MNEQEQRIAIHQAVGETLYVITKRGYYYRENAGGYTASIEEAWKLPYEEAKKYEMYADRTDVPGCEKVLIEPAPIPDYLNDLNAMHEAEKVLTGAQWDDYTARLDHLTRVANRLPRWRDINPSRIIDAFQIHADADVKAEAFLRTLNLWKESE